jgi:hypothetical protein
MSKSQLAQDKVDAPWLAAVAGQLPESLHVPGCSS